MTADASLGRGCVIQAGQELAILSSDMVSSRDFWCPLGEAISANRRRPVSWEDCTKHVSAEPEPRCRMPGTCMPT